MDRLVRNAAEQGQKPFQPAISQTVSLHAAECQVKLVIGAGYKFEPVTREDFH